MNITWQFVNNKIWQKTVKAVGLLIELDREDISNRCFEILYKNLISSVEDTGGKIASFSEISKSARQSSFSEQFQKNKILEAQEGILKSLNILMILKEYEYISSEKFQELDAIFRDIFTNLGQLGQALTMKPEKPS